ncbi:MAG: metallophosphoesterase [Acidobacteriota bacterium]
MKIGILSDTHDDVAATTKALELIRAHSCELLIHAGDLCSPFIARLIKDSGLPHAAVFGNNDGDRVLLSSLIDIRPAPRQVQAGNTSIVVFHEPFINDYVDPQRVNLLIYGHTHQVSVEEKGRMLMLNPGTVSGVLAPAKTCAVYDTASRKVEIIEL